MGSVLGTTNVTTQGSFDVPANDPQYQAWIQFKQSGLPGASTISFEDFKKANARAAANGYQVGNSSSSNPVQPHHETKSCPLCNGSGKCSSCNGTHRINYQFGSGTLECPNCKPNGACSSCGGSGEKASTKYY